jgi:hypothetical protein
MGWLLQNLVSSIVYTLLALAGGVAMTILKKKGSAWASPVLYGLATVAFIFIMIFTFTGHAVFSPSRTNETNVEQRITGWSQRLGLAVQVQPAPEGDFSYRIQLLNGTAIMVSRDVKTRPDFLTLQTFLAVPPEHTAAMNKLTKEERGLVVQEVQLELSKTRFGFIIASQDPSNPIQNIGLTRPIQINGLTEESFDASLDEMDNTVHLVQSIVPLAIARNGPTIPQPVVTK